MSGKARVLLIAPTALDYYGQPIKQKRVYLPGLTMAMLAAVTPDEVDLHIIQETIQEVPYDEQWALVGITGMGSGLVRAWQIADEFRARNVKVAIGGIAATLSDHDQTYAHADTLILGEAEELWPQVLKDLLNGQLKNRYTMDQRPDIASLPVPKYEALNKNELVLWRPVQATRGCPFPCSFCSIQSYFNRQYRKRPVKNVIRDVRAARATGSKYIAFIDDNIGVDWKYFEELMHALIPEKVIWVSQCSLQIADHPDMLELAYKSGCRVLSFGIESVNEGSVNAIGKFFNDPKDYDEKLRMIRESGIAVSSEMIVGMDGDTEDTFDATYDFVMRNKIPVPRYYILTPVPGTQMHKEFMEDGRIFDGNMANYSGGRAVFYPRNMTADALDAGYWRLYNKTYSIPGIYHRMKGVPRGLGLKLSTFVLGVNIHYRSHVKKRICPGII